MSLHIYITNKFQNKIETYKYMRSCMHKKEHGYEEVVHGYEVVHVIA
tara:strand:+ start:1815 stop:1955 length:141 start_codon:yes stop_codon:yes gene_type:complete